MAFISILNIIVTALMWRLKLTQNCGILLIRENPLWWLDYLRAMSMSMIGTRILSSLLELCTIVFFYARNWRTCEAEPKGP